MKLLNRIILLLCMVSLLCGTAQAETAVTFEDMHYGDEAFQMHLNNEVNKLIFQGEEYLLEDDRFEFSHALPVYGGKTRAVYEMTIPQDQFTVTSTAEQLLGTVVIDIPHKATLWVGAGNRRSGEYILTGPITLTDVYTEQIYLPRNAAGEPLLVDRVYLYSYEVNGETRRYAATLYLDYENYAAAYATTVMTGLAPIKVEQIGISPAAAVGAVLVVVAIVLFIFKRKKQPARDPAKLPAAISEEAPFAEKAEALLRQIEDQGSAITDDEITGKVTALLALCRKIIKAAAEHPNQEQQCRRFLNYYLPTTLKILTAYRSISESGVSPEEVNQVRQSTCKGLDMILEACQTLLDNLYKGEMLSATLDVEILEKMLKQDGLIENELDLSKVIPLNDAEV